MGKKAKIVLHGNNARIDPKSDITPINLTNAITNNKTQKNGNVINVKETDAAFSKKAVDENKK